MREISGSAGNPHVVHLAVEEALRYFRSQTLYFTPPARSCLLQSGITSLGRVRQCLGAPWPLSVVRSVQWPRMAHIEI